ncbi:MAG: LacI family DNA-binding transcriptional regulator [Lachnospiraceae bacterium]
MKVTVKEIADALELSTSTVSRALNDNELISKATRDAVKQKAVDMGYFQDSLKIVKDFNRTVTRLIGICVPNLKNPICIDVIKGVQEYFSVRDYGVLVMDSEENLGMEERNIKALLELSAQGLIVFPTSAESAERIKPYTEGRVPTAYVCNISEDKNIHSIGIDEEQAFRVLTEYLMQMGHEKIAFIGGSQKFVNRVRGFEKAVGENKNAVSAVIRCEPTQQAGFRMMKRLIENQEEFTAIVAASDFIALGAMDAIYDSGKRIPEDYSLVGLDNIDISGNKRIDLTTVNQPGREIGMKASEIIYHEMINGPYEYKCTEIFDTFLVIRGSSGRRTR